MVLRLIRSGLGHDCTIPDSLFASYILPRRKNIIHYATQPDIRIPRNICLCWILVCYPTYIITGCIPYYSTNDPDISLLSLSYSESVASKILVPINNSAIYRIY